MDRMYGKDNKMKTIEVSLGLMTEEDICSLIGCCDCPVKFIKIRDGCQNALREYVIKHGLILKITGDNQMTEHGKGE